MATKKTRRKQVPRKAKEQRVDASSLPRMMVSRLRVKNWKSFKKIDVKLHPRNFIVGPNSSGKSNLVDLFRFLHVIARPGGGLAAAVRSQRHPFPIQSLHDVDREPTEIEIWLADIESNEELYHYKLCLKNHAAKLRVIEERVWSKKKSILKRPDESDLADPVRMTQTALEQVTLNRPFRELVEFLSQIADCKTVPELIRQPELLMMDEAAPNLGVDLFQRFKALPKAERVAINKALIHAIPNFHTLSVFDFEKGTESKGRIEGFFGFEHIGKRILLPSSYASEGTLRLLGLLVSLVEGSGLLILEEPEISLHAGVVRKLPPLIYRVQREKQRQVILTTHSAELLWSEGISAEEIILLKMTQKGSEAHTADKIQEVATLLDAGFRPAEAALPWTEPPGASELDEFP